ncbi:uncharacterized protein AB675_9948 [Cyphellophora attinorum]|uniref:Uncharacterized protein n=1 Tax=Cyphellophora attinorum TaxID=1664694 RepID=A0A0N1GY04_9EURO|nr:uncharacterized protein AB675_9948 [Phialophora attinorum]KPI35355.1 hypothetical protein AB675_9948 [Phialophora attinorum]
MAKSGLGRQTYTIEVKTSEIMQEVLTNAEYHFRVGDASGTDEAGKFRGPATHNIVHEKKESKVHAHSTIHATFELDAVPSQRWWMGYMTNMESKEILGQKRISFGQIYALTASGVEVRTPDFQSSWVPKRGFGFQNHINAAPVLLREPSNRHCGNLTSLPDSAAVRPWQPLWVPGVGRLEPRVRPVKRKVAMWFQNKYNTAMLSTSDQSLKWEVEWDDYGEAHDRELTVYYWSNGQFHGEEEPAPFSQGGFQEVAPSKDLVPESQNNGFDPASHLPDEEYQNTGFDPDNQLPDDDYQNTGFDPENEIPEDSQNQGFQPDDGFANEEINESPAKGANGTALKAKKAPQALGTRLKVTMMNGGT